MDTKITGYWTFFCNPAKWEIDKFLSTNTEYDNYQVNDWYEDHIKPGQLGVVRVGVDSRNKKQLGNRSKLSSGIYAIVEILDNPHMSIDNSVFYLNEEDQKQIKLRVNLRYLKNLLTRPLLLNKLKSNTIVNQDEYLINGFQRSTMPLKKATFDEIINILGYEDQIFNNIESEKADTLDDIASLESKYRDASPQVKEVISKRIERGKISSLIKKKNNFKCNICDALGYNPHSFKKKNGEFYIEAHHIIPVSYLIKGSLGISNIITVCANHHRQFHYGNINIVENTNELLALIIDCQSIRINKTKLNITLL